jgi:hypothetical protein
MLSDIINEVQSIVKAVTNVGSVHAYRRAVQTESDFLDVYKDEATGMIRAWDITRESTASEDHTVGATQESHLIVLRGYMSVSDKDASEQTFQNLIEDVRAALRMKRNLNAKLLDTTPVQARSVTAAMIGNVLCHYAELSFTAIEFPVSTT